MRELGKGCKGFQKWVRKRKIRLGGRLFTCLAPSAGQTRQKACTRGQESSTLENVAKWVYSAVILAVGRCGSVCGPGGPHHSWSPTPTSKNRSPRTPARRPALQIFAALHQLFFGLFFLLYLGAFAGEGPVGVDKNFLFALRFGDAIDGEVLKE